jgi:hypothetical protein
MQHNDSSSSSVGRWDQQHNGVVFMVESVCRQGFTYMHKEEEDWQKN